jgi:hypothetical protein
MTVAGYSDKEVAEKTVWVYGSKVKKEDKVTPVVPADLATLTITVYALDAALTIVNSLNATNILNVGRGTLDAAGELAIVLAGDDLALIDATAPYEDHVMLIQGTWATGTRALRRPIYHRVVNLARV